MQQKELTELTDQELLEEAKKMKSSSIIHALFIGAMIGVVIYSVVKNSFGFFGLILLFFAFKFFHNPENNKRHEALKTLLKERNLK
jgi:uncharacterized membrane protein YfcA